MKRFVQSRCLVFALAVLAAAACFCGSPKAEQDGPKTKPTQPAGGGF